MENNTNTERYLRAKKRVQEIKGFFGNLLIYCLVIPVLAYINWRGTDFPWVIFPALGWGFGLLMHGFKVFGYNLILGRDWEQRKIREYMSDDSY
jgi:hypothetical protein